jgi:hypothetical protein
MPNLLQNPGFEEGWWRKTFNGQEFGEIFSPEHWVAFWKEGGPVEHDPHNKTGYGRPEMHVINREPPFLDPLRIRSGQRSAKLFTFFRIHDAGYYQQVSGVEVGTTLRATGWAHAWSSNEDNPRASDGVGAEPFAIQASEYDKVDGVRNFTFYMGIDPMGGTDPWSDSVVWGEGAHIYNAFAQIPPAEAEAKASTVTVFVRSVELWPFKHCDAYFDDMSLVPVEVSDKPVKIESVPSRAVAGEPFEIVASGGGGGEHLEITFEGPEIFYGEPRVVSGQSVRRAVALEPGTYVVHVASTGGAKASESFDVRPQQDQDQDFVPPREPYARTYLLLPPDAGEAWLQAVAESGVWDRHHWTIGGSADDAGIGPAQRRVLAVNPQLWPGVLEDFFSTHYPGLAYQELRAATPSDLRRLLSNM